MNASIFDRLLRPLKKYISGSTLVVLLTLILMLTGTAAFSQSTVTTITDNNNGKGGYKNGNTFTTARFKNPLGIALDPSGTTLFMADNANNAIRMITTVGNKSTSLTYSAYTNKDGISHPVAVAIDANTNIYVLNQGTGKNGTLLQFNGYYLYNYNIHLLSHTFATKLINATSVALDVSANTYVTVQSNTVIRITQSGITSTIGTITNSRTSLRGIVVLPNGSLALTDAGNNGIWIMNTNGTYSQFTGFLGANDSLGPPGWAAFNGPANIALAGNGALVVADYNNAKVKVIDTNGIVSLLYGVAPKYWTRPYPGWRDGTVNQGETVVTVQARQPFGLAVGPDASVYVTETYYSLLRVATGTGLTPLPPPPPSAPTITSVTTNYGQVILTWSAVTGATNYNIYKSSATNGPFTIPFASTTGTTYTDTNVVNGNTYYYEVSASDAGGQGPNSPEVSVTLPLAPVPNPQIGTVSFPSTSLPVAYTSVFDPFTSVTNDFYNNQTIIIAGTPGTDTHYTIDGSTPTASSPSIPSDYHDGLSDVSAYAISQVAPSLTIQAIGTKSDGSPNSQVVSATVNYITGNPLIAGTNIYDFQIGEITTNAQLFYTLDGSDPRLNGLSLSLVADFNPTNNSWVVTKLPTILSNTLFQVYALNQNYQPSAVVSNLFLFDSAVNNTINFGFASGPGSSQFVASPGQSFVLPVAVNLLPDAPPIYGLQFNLTVTNLGPNAITPGAINFDSFIGKPDQANDGYYEPIPPYEFIGNSQPNNDPNAVQLPDGSWYQSSLFVDTNNENLLGVGWLEVLGRTNLYNTVGQNLLSYPIIVGTDPYPTSSQVVVGGYSFAIPTNAEPTDIYQVQIGRPSATTFPAVGIGYGIPVTFDAPANTNLLGPGSINALKNVTIGQLKYLVGDVVPANWFNAGDFGYGDLIKNGNNDVLKVFDFAAYPIATPPVKSDLFDAMDSCGNIGVLDTVNGYYTNASVYPMFTNLVNAVTNYTYVYDTNGVSVISVTPGLVISYTTNIYITTYFVSVPYYITNIFTATAPAPPTITVSSTSYNYAITPPVNALFNGNDTNIDQIAFGDGVLDVCDVYVTFRRSEDPNRIWFERYWTNGVRVASSVANKQAKLITKSVSVNDVQPRNQNSAPLDPSAPPQVVFAAGNVQGSAGQTVKVPITATIYGSFPIRLLMLNLSVEPLANAPSLPTAVQFNQTATELGNPYLTSANLLSANLLSDLDSSYLQNISDNGNYAAVWLNDTSATGTGVLGAVTIGTLSVAIPANAPSGATYGVYFDHASASPNGLASFPNQTLTGFITVQ